MSGGNVPAFLRHLACHHDELDALKTMPKGAVIKRAAEIGLEFSEREFDTLIWGVEERLAALRGEDFNATFPLWDLMWGKYYLEYLVSDLSPSCDEVGIPEFSNGG
jgi:hypothetical protein